MEPQSPRKLPSQSWRSEASSNWRVKDSTPRMALPPAEKTPPSRTQFDCHAENGSSSTLPVPPESLPGARLYVGNLVYKAQEEDIEKLFSENGFSIAKIDMSIDPFTGRNPSYCFVDLETAEDASRAMAELNGKEILGRVAKIKPGVAKRPPEYAPTPTRGWGTRDTAPARNHSTEYKPTFDRWSRTDAHNHWEGPPLPGHRLYVGGLPRIDGQPRVDAEIQALFRGFQLTAVSKIISPHESKASQPGHHFYLFVDLVSSEEAERAISVLNGKSVPWGGRLRVNRTRDGPGKKVMREQFGGKVDDEKQGDSEAEGISSLSSG
ncbi:hypothetical protein HWV62_11800 [Athelia sp. TMB]|nr:hypothetical protein HWV62_11800 [Athelia sp. TMB]